MKRIARALAASALLAVSILACVDLFHDTDDLVAPCENGACVDGAPLPPDAASTPALRCTSDATAALEQAKAACSWLGACAGPFGVNEPGACLLEALRAFDCALDPFNPPRAERADFWNCMQTASESPSCDAVRRCVFPRANHLCGNSLDVFACPDVSPDAGADRFVRVLCAGGEPVPAGGENCAAAGGRCVKRGAYQGCSTAIPSAGATECTRSRCENGTLLSLCDADGGVEAAQVDCTLGGAGRCGSGSDEGPGCVAEQPPDGGCSPESPIECNRGVASRCRNGAFEEVSCARAGLGCSAADAELTHEACRFVATDAGATADAGDAGTEPCELARCVSGNVQACLRGRTVSLSCASQGLGACKEVTAVGFSAPACSPPGADAAAP